MRSEAIIRITCDICQTTIELVLPVTSKGYDERNLNDDLINEGWAIIDHGDDALDVCPDCQEDPT